SDIWALLRMRAEQTGERPALLWHPYEGAPATWTYAELCRDAAAVAAGLARRGVRAGDKVLIHLENCPEFVIAWYACAALRAVALTPNSRSAGDELSYYAEDCQAVGAITQPRLAELVSGAAPGLRWQAVTTHDAGVPAGSCSGDESFDSLYAAPDI